MVGKGLCGYDREGSVWVWLGSVCVGMIGKCLCGYGREVSVWVW